MATREEWVRHFEDVNGRKPSPEEFMEAKKEGFVIASEEQSAPVSEQVEAQQVDSSEATEEVTADSVADTQPDEAQVALEEEAPKLMPELNMEKEQEKEAPKASQIPLENPYYKPKVTKNNAFVNIALPIIILVLGILFVIFVLDASFRFCLYFPCLLPYHSSYCDFGFESEVDTQGTIYYCPSHVNHLLHDFACWSRLSSSEICHEPC